MSGQAFTAAQRAAIEAPGDLFLRAGAGSGKTRVLVERVLRALEGGARPQQLTCVTFTELAAAELRGRIRSGLQGRAAAQPARWAHALRELPLMTVGTIHHLCAAIARAHPALSGAGMGFEVHDETAERLWRRQHLSSVLAALPPEVVLAVPGELRGAVLAALLDDPARAQRALQQAAGTADEDELSRAAGRLFEQVHARVGALRTEQGAATFADLESWAARALAHGEVREYYHGRVAHLLVDEVQDTSAAQWSILRALAGDQTVLTLVGDRQQSIYAFRGADPQLFTAAEALVRGRGGLVLDMHTSFRSEPALVRALNGGLGCLMPGPGEGRPTASPFRPLEAGRVVHLPPEPAVELHTVLGDAVSRPRALARVLVSALQARLGRPVFDRAQGTVRGARWADMALLMRSRTHLDDLEFALREAGVPYAVHGGRDLYRRPEVQEAMALLRVLADPTDDLALLATLRGPYVGWTEGELLALAQLRSPGGSLWGALGRSGTPAGLATAARLRGWRAAAAGLSASQILQRADQDTGVPALQAALPDGARRVANRSRFDALLRLWAAAGRRDVLSVSRHLEALLAVAAPAAEAPSPLADAVQVMTVHAAKGLEFPVVAYTGLLPPQHVPPSAVRHDEELGLIVRGRGAPPARWAASEARAREARRSEHERLTYVALTRAADHLILGVAPGPRDTAALQDVLGAFADAARHSYVAAGVAPVTPLPLARHGGRLVLQARPGPGVALPGHLPVTALGEYQRCPQAFAWRHLYGYLPLAHGWGAASPTRAGGREIGLAVHRALEGHWTPRSLPRRLAGMARADVEEVAGLLGRLDGPAYVDLREGTWEREVPLRADFGRVTLHGVADALNRERGTVIDYKTDHAADPDEHRLQLAAYAWALAAPRAGLVYLRHDRVHWFGEDELRRALEDARAVVGRMIALDLAPTPSTSVCGSCAYVGVCTQAAPDMPG